MTTVSDRETVSSKASEAHNNCLKMMDKSLRRCPKVKFMIERLEKLGCPLPQDFIHCKPCEGLEASGGWEYGAGPEGASKPKVVLCEDKAMMTQWMVDHTLAHELIHAYDQCRVKVDWNDCLHHACSEIRASNTSGECSYAMEFRRGHWDWGGQQKVGNNGLVRRSGKQTNVSISRQE
ncbi:unnamed protein product [Choristocarpus tenellus]